MGSIKLEKYLDKFVDNGVEDLETILELRDEHIEQIGIPLGHKLKIMKRIKDLRADKGMTVPQSREGTTRPDVQPLEKSDQKPSLKNGTYDEGESHNQFLEALNAWRSAAPPKKVTFNEKENQIKQVEDRKTPQQKKVSKNESCWNCYKLYVPTEATSQMKNGDKNFCSDFCNKSYSLQNSKSC